MKYLLDTNACIRYLNGKSELLRQRIDSTGDDEIVVCSIVEAELFFGAAKSSDPPKTLQRQHTFLSRFLSLPFDSASADVYGPVRAALEVAGTPIGAHDLLISAVALTRQLTVVTANTAEFQRVPGLQIENWEVAAT
ncbi:MAG TPA: type II toxin-antitoxin system VapC family toxin [Pirellulales bacterium]|nr:type II toxin-antitoxin system VapC family toxin [Pirellulales bacterium]